jgi:gamma-tubulin complex component 3
MMNKFRLQQHCFGIKKYILLSAGDFIQHLMDIISPELEKKADRIFAHNMMGFIQQAARSSNAQYDDEDTLNRLSVHILTVC